MTRLASILVTVALAACTCPHAPPRPEGCEVKTVAWGDLPGLGYTVMDEPFWRCDAEWCDVKADDPPPGVDVAAVEARIAAFADAAHAAGKRAWVNLSYPEVNWLASGKISIAPAVDRLSFDFYRGRCHWDEYRLHAYWLGWASGGRQTAMVVENETNTIGLAVEYACSHGQDLVVVWPGFNCLNKEPYTCR